MKNTWASGAIELLDHADSHISSDSAFDRRIAFISVDNAVETMIRTFLSLPSRKSGIRVSRKEFDTAENSFPKLVALLWSHVAKRLAGIDGSDIEHYHRIRNKLYHDGTGLSVDEQYLLAYREIAVIILENLFGVKSNGPRPAATLGHLIDLWNRLEKVFTDRLEDAGINRGHTFFWEAAIKEGILSSEDAVSLTELRMIRNKQVHSVTIDQKQIEYAIHLAESLLTKFGYPK